MTEHAALVITTSTHLIRRSCAQSGRSDQKNQRLALSFLISAISSGMAFSHSITTP